MATFTVTTNIDELNAGATAAAPGGTGLSLREAVALANASAGADIIEFDASFSGGAASLIRLTLGEIEITGAVTINGSTGTGIVITGDKNNDDTTIGTTDITDVAASGAALLADNSRIFKVTGGVADTTLQGLTLTAGRTTANAQGGGAVDSDSALTVIDSIIAGNSTSGTGSGGGGLHVLNTLTLTDSTLSGNSTSGLSKALGGGAVADDLIVSGSTISGNSSETGAGGLVGSTISLTNTTVVGNSAALGGGGIAGDTIELHNSTVTGNIASGAGSIAGGVAAVTSLTLENSIVLGNQAAVDREIALSTGDPLNNVPGTTLTLLGSNIVGENAAAFDITGHTNIINADPRAVFTNTVDLDPNVFILHFGGVATDNGGPVQTVALNPLITNPALDAATTALTTDARGVARSVDLPGVGATRTADLGAYEVQTLASAAPQSFVVTTANDELDFIGPDATLALMGGAADLSLREAIVLANQSGSTADTITFSSTVFTGGAASLVRLTHGEIQITDSVKIDGSTGTDIVITGDKDDNDVTVGATDITDVAASGSALLADNSRIFSTTLLSGPVTLQGLTLTGGHTTVVGFGSGGGAVAASNDLTVIDSTVTGNSTEGFAGSGGGLAVSGTLTLTNSTVSNNSTSGTGKAFGGGATAKDMVVTNSTVTGNSTLGKDSSGGGLESGGTLDITGSVISGNSTAGDNSTGGGVHGDIVTVTDSVVSGNSTHGASYGGGIAGVTQVTLTRTTVSGNSTTADFAGGGGISGAAVELHESTVSGNSTAGGVSPGGGIAGFTVELTNSTVAGNTVTGSLAWGGGVWADTSITLLNTTVSGNAVNGFSAEGGGLYANNITLTNSIVLGNNSSTVGPEIGGALTMTGSGLNIVGPGADTDASDHIINADPAAVFAQTFDNGGVEAGVLANNGGPVQTIALKPDATNPALDASDTSAPTLDATGQARFDVPGIANANGSIADLGALEAGELSSLVVTTLSDVVDAFDNKTSLREAVAFANSHAGADTITFDASVSGVVRLTGGELVLTEAATVDGGNRIVVTGDSAGNDVLAAGFANITDAGATLGAGTASDNTRIFNAGSADLTVKNITLTGGMPDGQGGAISGGNVTVLHSIIMGNVANASNGQASGGGIIAANVTVTDSTISGNFSAAGSPSSGGGIAAGINAIITNSTISGNFAEFEGGGVIAGGTVTLLNATVTGNTAGYGGGVYGIGGVEATNSIVLSNSAFQNTNIRVAFGFGTPTFNGLNIVGTGSDTDASDHVINADPTKVFAQTVTIGGGSLSVEQAGVLADNGGGVPTVALKLDATNPALDSASTAAPAADERGSARQDMAGIGSDGAKFADLGAFEALDARPTVGYTPVLFSIAENASTATRIKVADINITDPDGHNALFMSGADAAFFEILNDAIYLKAGVALDFETKPQFDIVFDVKPFGFGLYRSEDVLHVTDVNEAPAGLSFANVRSAIAENTSTATHIKVADIKVTSDSLLLSLSGRDAALFELAGKELYLKAGVVLDFETQSKVQVIVNADDPSAGGPVDAFRAFNLTVTDVVETITGTACHDKLYGGVGADCILGLAGNDIINGRAGNDRIIGCGGADTMTGGAGADAFVLSRPGDSPSGGRHDVITDFKPGTDRIDLKAMDANTAVSGDQAFKFLGTGSFTSKPGELIYRQFDSAGTAHDKTIVYGDVNGDKLADFQIELSGLKTLAAADFVL